MAKPGTVPTWDSNGTNVTVPPADYQSDGWGGPSRKLGVSGYMNWFMRWVYLWIAFLNATFNAAGDLIRGNKKRLIPFSNVKLISGSTTSYTIDSFSTGGTCVFGIYPTVNEGERIKGFRFYIGDSGGGTTFKLYKRAQGGSPAQVGPTATATATAGGLQTVALDLVTPEPYVSSYSYYVEMSFTGFEYSSAEIITDVV